MRPLRTDSQTPTTSREKIEALLADVTTEEVCRALDGFNIPVARINSLDDLHNDPQIQHSRSLVKTTHPVLGEMRYARPPFNFEGQAEFPERHAPFLGDHTREILDDLGIENTVIERLEKRESENRALIESYGG